MPAGSARFYTCLILRIIVAIGIGLSTTLAGEGDSNCWNKIHFGSSFDKLIKQKANLVPRRSASEIVQEARLAYTENLDGSILASRITVSLRCPLTQERLGNPARSRNCRHVQCFDLFGWLAISLKPALNYYMESSCWTGSCPICNCKVQFSDLYIDEYFESILKGLDPKETAVTINTATFDWELPRKAPKLRPNPNKLKINVDIIDLTKETECESCIAIKTEPIETLLPKAEECVDNYGYSDSKLYLYNRAPSLGLPGSSGQFPIILD